MAAFLDPFSISRVRAPIQGFEISDLVRKRAESAVSVFPNLKEGYKHPTRAWKRVASLATREGILAYVVRRSPTSTAQGVATLITGDRIEHPSMKVGKLTMPDLDYWLQDGADDELHHDTAKALIAKSKQQTHTAITTSASDGTTTAHELPYKDFAFTVPHGAEKPHNRGLLDFGVQLGGPVILSTEQEGDPYGLTRDRSLVDLYVNPENYFVRWAHQREEGYYDA